MKNRKVPATTAVAAAAAGGVTVEVGSVRTTSSVRAFVSFPHETVIG
jgi:hypothetical protein